MSRVNRIVELLESGQPAYYTSPSARTRAGGVADSGTRADYIQYDMEIDPLDIPALNAYLQGMLDAGPTRSGHRTPAVVVSLPMWGTDATSVRVNAWMIRQVLAMGVHGLLLCHVEAPEAAKAFVEASRYPISRVGVGDGLDEGLRSHGGQARCAEVWGLESFLDYQRRADPWPLNPEGELVLGVKIENKRALARVEETLRVPGLTFAEWGPSDMSMSHGYAARPQEPFPPDIVRIRERVRKAAEANHLFFLESFTAATIERQLREGVMLGSGTPETIEAGRKLTGRTLES